MPIPLCHLAQPWSQVNAGQRVQTVTAACPEQPLKSTQRCCCKLLDSPQLGCDLLLVGRWHGCDAASSCIHGEGAAICGGGRNSTFTQYTAVSATVTVLVGCAPISCPNTQIPDRPQNAPSVVTIIAVPLSPAAAAASSSAAVASAATAALLRLLRPVAAAAAAGCFLMRVMQPTMEAPAGAAACSAGVMSDAAMVLPLLRVMLGWMDRGEPGVQPVNGKAHVAQVS